MELFSVLKTFALAVLAVFAPIKMVVISAFVLILTDLIFGIWAAHKRGEQITSAWMGRTVTKMLVYQVAILTGFLLETYLIGGSIPVSKLVAGVIGMVEFKSILENANDITGTDIFKQIISKLGSKNAE